MQCLLVFPLMWGISSVAPEIVTVLLGHGWQGAALPLQLLALVMPLNALSYFFNAAFQGLGHARVVFSNVLTAGLIMPISFFIGAVWGINGLALAWVVAFPLVVILNLRRMLPLVNVTFRRVGMAIGPAVGAAGVMYIAVVVARNVTDGANPLVQLVALVATGVASYSFMTWKLNRAGAIELAEVMRLPLMRRS
jgi:O-antigen/teichoic acid export membrane protein